MAGSDVFAQLVRGLADIGHEIATTLANADKRANLLARTGRLPPASPPPASPGAATTLAALRDRASADGANAFELLRDFSDAMVALVALVQEAAAISSVDDAWNMIATWFDVIAVDRFRKTNLELVALLKAAHLLSDDRLLIADLIRSRDQWGRFLLGNPADDEAKADNWSVILGAVLAVAGKCIPQEDEAGETWRIDMLFGWDPDPDSPAPGAERALQRMATMRFTHRGLVGGVSVEEHAGISAVVVPPASGGWGMYFGIDSAQG